jgi:uncharacterized phage protein gp47/JayE
MPYIPRYKKEIFDELISIVVAQSALTDINPGSVLTHILGSVAQELELVEFRMKDIRDSFSLSRATGVELDFRVADLPPAGLERVGPSNAGGASLVVTFTEALEGDLVIPTGSTYAAANDGGILYTQTESVTAPAGTSQYPADPAVTPYIRVLCDVAGTVGNRVIGEITEIRDAPAEILTVNNPLPVTGGSDGESDSNLRSRAQSYLGALSRVTAQALKFVCATYETTTGERVRHVNVIEDALTPGFTEVVIDPGGSGLDEALLNQPQGATVLDAGEQFAWLGAAPSILYHSFPAVQAITEDSIQIVVYDKKADPEDPDFADGDTGLFFDQEVSTVAFSDPAVKSFYNIPIGIDPFISVHERGHLYIDTFFPMDRAPNWGYEDGDPYYNTKVELTIKPFTRYVGTVAEVQSLIEGDVNDPATFPGYRPAGCRVVVRLPFYQTAGTFKINLTLESGILIKDVQDVVRFEVADLVAQLAPGEPLKLAAIIESLMGMNSINNVKITSPVDDVDCLSNRHSLRLDPTEIILS